MIGSEEFIQLSKSGIKFKTGLSKLTSLYKLIEHTVNGNSEKGFSEIEDREKNNLSQFQ